MKVTEYHSHFQVECSSCGEKFFVGRAEMSEVVEKLFDGKVIVDFSLTCRCKAPAGKHKSTRTGRLETV